MCHVDRIATLAGGARQGVVTLVSVEVPDAVEAAQDPQASRTNEVSRATEKKVVLTRCGPRPKNRGPDYLATRFK